MPITVATLNVNGYRVAGRGDVGAHLAALDADVVLTQEDTSGRECAVPGYTLVSSAPTGEQDLANCVRVRTAALPWVAGAGALVLRAVAAPTPRSAAWVAVHHPDGRPRVFVSTHLVGGRNDDQRYDTERTTRAAQLTEIVQQLQPALIGGDYNAEQEPHRVAAALGRHPLVRALRLQSERDAYYAYYTSGAAELAALGYRRAYGGDDGFPTGTCAFGSVVDWMYFRPDLLTVTWRRPRVDASGRWCSDHGAVVMQFE